MSLWQFCAAAEGYRKAHDPEADKEVSEVEEDALWAWIQT